MSDQTKLYLHIVELQSVPGPYTQHGPGEVKVYALDEKDAEEKAYIRLKRGAFPHRTRKMWKILSVTRIEE